MDAATASAGTASAARSDTAAAHHAPRGRAAPTTEEGSVLSTLNEDGSRRWLKPRPSPGRWLTRRRIVAYALIAVFAIIPHLRMNGKPLVLLDLTTRRFTILGHTFLPTDTLLLALLLLGIFVSIFLFTALLGRVWCGWACPQTVYMEFVFRPIERLLEGAPGRAKKGLLQTTPLGRVLKYPAYFAVACFLAHTFLAYFVGVERLAQWVRQSPLEHPTPFLVMAVVTGLMLFDFTFFREQTCLVACPYGRMQSTLLDRNSLIVSYDARRGEPRGRPRSVPLPVVGEGAARTGDCVDCGLCVLTCPTGIDIRNGLQMECVHCTQCMDACDAVMSKLGRETGLIRYGSQNEMEGKPRKFIRPRTLIYPAILAVIATLFVLVLGGQGPAYVSVLRARGAVYTPMGEDRVANQVMVKIVNRTEHDATFAVHAEPETVEARLESGPALHLRPGEMRTVPATLVAPRAMFEHGKLPVRVVVTGPDGLRADRPFVMAGPGTSHAPGTKEAPKP